jgi:hypothetical protein
MVMTMLRGLAGVMGIAVVLTACASDQATSATAASGSGVTASQSVSPPLDTSIPEAVSLTTVTSLPSSSDVRSASSSEVTTTTEAMPEVTLTNADGYSNVTIRVGGVIRIRLTGSGPNDGWQAPFSDDETIVRTDRSVDSDAVDGSAQGDFTAIAEGQDRLTSVHTCAGTQCTASVWWVNVTVTS